MSSLDLFEGSKSIHLATVRNARFEIGRGNMERRTSRENYRPFYDVLHFTDITRPGIANQCAHGLRRDCVYLLLHVACKELGEVPNQEGNVLRAFA